MKASEEQIAQSLDGNWQQDLLFVLKQEKEVYEFRQQQMAECDRQLNHYLQQRQDRSQAAPLPVEKRHQRLKKKKGNKPQFDLREGLFRMTGTDLTQIDCVDVMTAEGRHHKRGGMGYEQMGNRKPLRFLVTTGQSN